MSVCIGKRVRPDASRTRVSSVKPFSRTSVQLPVQATSHVLDQHLNVPWCRIEIGYTKWQTFWNLFVGTFFTSIHLLSWGLAWLLRNTTRYRLFACDTGPNTSRRRPRYTKNELDMVSRQHLAHDELEEVVTGATELFRATRLVRPKRLVVFADNTWLVVKEPPANIEYAFISWHWASFKYDRQNPRKRSLAAVKGMAQHATLDSGLRAYWLDVQCITDNQSDGLFSSDVYGMADIVRNAHHVAILLPDEHSFYKREWARRLWTLPEGLLAKGKLRIWTATTTQYIVYELDRAEMTRDFWRPFENDERRFPTRILAEYFEGLIELSHLELITTSIVALSGQDSSDHTKADIAYALMGLLRKRIAVNREDSLFQAMTKLLSLTGNNEFVIERMISCCPAPATDFKMACKALLNRDQFGTHIWDIDPRCEVVGLDEQDGVVLLNDCRTLPICHYSLPSQVDQVMGSIQTFIGLIRLLLCAILFAASHLLLKLSYVEFACLACIAITALLFPTICRGTQPIRREFVLIEGALPLLDLKRAIHYSTSNELSYSTNSSPLKTPQQDRDPPWTEPGNLQRWTRELYSARAADQDPDWIPPARQGMPPTSPTSTISPISPLLRRTSLSAEQPGEAYYPPLFPGHYVFTLVNMSSGTVSLIQAKAPPTTLLLTGTEGGMLRAVLCSSYIDDDGSEILQKESVVRLDPELWEYATPRSWLRVNVLPR